MKRILILEDHIQTLEKILQMLLPIEEDLEYGGKQLAVTVLSEYTQVEEYINKSEMTFDLILLDRDCKAGGSFHILDFQKFDPEKIIAISSVPEYNEQAREKGVVQIVHKDYQNLDGFIEKLEPVIRKYLIQ
jgi:hypothetical protein